MIRVLYEPCISSMQIKDEIWYPEINKKAVEYYDYLYREVEKNKGITVITYSPIILDCLEVIAKKRNLDIQVESGGKTYVEGFTDVYMIHCKAMRDVDKMKWEMEDDD